MFCMKCLTYNGKKTQKDSKLRVITRKVEPEFEFIILASDGIWEVISSSYLKLAKIAASFRFSLFFNYCNCKKQFW